MATTRRYAKLTVLTALCSTLAIEVFFTSCARPQPPSRVLAPANPYVDAEPSRVDATPPSESKVICSGLSQRSQAVYDHALARRRATYDAALANGDLVRRRDERVADAKATIAHLRDYAARDAALSPWEERRDYRGLERALPDLEKLDPYTLPERLGHLPEEVGKCHPFARGAWALVLEELELGDWDDDQHVDGRWVIVHATLDGRIDRAEVKTFSQEEHDSGVARSNCCEVYQAVGMFLDGPVLFDFDSDGEPEIFVRAMAQGNEGYEEWASYLLTYRDGKIATYFPDPIESLVDVTGDGRPDIVNNSYDEDMSGAAGFSLKVFAGRKVLASTPEGKFVTWEDASVEPVP